MNVLQRITDLSRHMGHAMANARMALKLGEPITPQECVDLHREVMERMNLPDHGRFMPVEVNNNVPRLQAPVLCTHDITAAQARLHAYALDVKHVTQFNAKYCYTVTQGPSSAQDQLVAAVPACIIFWSFHQTVS